MSGGTDPTPGAREETLRRAEAAGYVVVYGNPVTLQLDLDSENARKTSMEMIERFSAHLKVSGVNWLESHTPEHFHVYVSLEEPLPREDRLLWQVALGSDPVRGVLDWLWMRAGHEEECFLVDRCYIWDEMAK